MSRFATLKSVAVFVLCAVLLQPATCVRVTTPTPISVGVSSYPSSSPAGESDTVWWDAVPGAVSYNLYYTTDGTDPTSNSTYISLSGGTLFVHTGLNPALTYTYSVQAVGRSSAGLLSDPSYGVQPLPMLHATITFNDYANSDVGFMFFQVDGSSYAPIAGTKQTLAATTDDNGNATFNVTVDHENYWGYSTFKDMDYSGTLTAGDTVWGNVTLAGHYGYIYWTSLLTSSKNIAISFDANTTFDSLPHVY
jgi:hypothetical protein